MPYIPRRSIFEELDTNSSINLVSLLIVVFLSELAKWFHAFFLLFFYHILFYAKGS
uniref:Uncharacterized protein n=1 Tax=Arundo donax TaxID=35708 RepID=A0A0A9GLP9_ARUDO